MIRCKTAYTYHCKLLCRFVGSSLCACIVLLVTSCHEGCLGDELSPDSAPANFTKSNLIAWCIVPFDAKQRGPEERAAMVRRLGLRRVAYDWRSEHIPTFESEIQAYQNHGVEFFAFWGWHDDIEPLIQQYGIKPQIWQTCKTIDRGGDEQKIIAAVKRLRPLVEKTRRLGLKLGLYNHGGWGGEPKNMVAVCKRLRSDFDAGHVGIIYNFHHGHAHVEDFQQHLRRMLPYLLCVNLNGMVDLSDPNDPRDANKITTVGAGEHEDEMIHTLIDSGYTGPIGIIGHRREVDVEQVLRDNIKGLDTIIADRTADPSTAIPSY